MKLKAAFIFLMISHFVSLSVHADVKVCYGEDDLNDFNTRWKISSVIEFEMGQVFCKIKYKDETDLCAAKYALESNNIQDLLDSYAKGTNECSSQIIQHCKHWCNSYSIDNFFCDLNCSLPNFQAVQ